uniref:Uncharacterized protein n=1 Tax=Knipowitschia caucasica TaxID=637954 RepID=A0AAV2KD32_KNICA
MSEEDVALHRDRICSSASALLASRIQNTGSSSWRLEAREGERRLGLLRSRFQMKEPHHASAPQRLRQITLDLGLITTPDKFEEGGRG